MGNFSNLLRLLRPGQGMDTPKDKRNKRNYTVFGGLAILFIMIPCCFIVGFIAYFITLAIMEAGGSDQGMLFIIQFISACAFIFGLNVMINELYFSSDLEHLLPLPIKTSELILAKFWVTYLSETVMEFLVIFSAYVGYTLALGVTPIGVISGIIGTISIAIVPLVYSGILSVLVMFLFQGIRSRKVLNAIMGGLTVVLLLGVFLSFRGLKGVNIDTYVDFLVNGNNAFMKVMNVVFYPGYLLIHSVPTGNWFMILGYLGLTVAITGVFLGIASVLYLPGLYSFKSIAANKEKHKTTERKMKSRSVFAAYFSKEIKTLFRTPALVSNCLLCNIFWPIIIVVVCLMQNKSHLMSTFSAMFKNGNIIAAIIVLAVFLGLAALTTAANSLASSAFTREGVHIDFMKYIPVPYQLQVQVKGLISFLFSFLSYLVDVAILTYVLKLNAFFVIYFIVAGALMIFFVDCMGLVLDSNHPKIIWEDELNALRGNLNVFYNMAFAMMSAVLIIALGGLLYLIPFTTGMMIYGFFLLLLGGICIFMYHYTMKKTAENLEHLSL